MYCDVQIFQTVIKCRPLGLLEMLVYVHSNTDEYNTSVFCCVVFALIFLSSDDNGYNSCMIADKEVMC